MAHGSIPEKRAQGLPSGRSFPDVRKVCSKQYFRCKAYENFAPTFERKFCTVLYILYNASPVHVHLGTQENCWTPVSWHLWPTLRKLLRKIELSPKLIYTLVGRRAGRDANEGVNHETRMYRSPHFVPAPRSDTVGYGKCHSV